MEIGKEFLYLTKEEVESLGITMKEVVDLMDEAFIMKGKGECEMPAKIGVHPRENDLAHAMPAWLKERNIIGIKWVFGCVDNPRKYNLPAVTAVQVLNDVDNGQVICIMDCTWVSWMRTGATCGTSAGALANPDSEIAGVIGCGAQARPGLASVCIKCPNIKKAYVYDLYPEASAKYAKEMSEQTGIEVIPVDNPKDAVVQADVLITAGPVLMDKSLGYVKPDWIKKGCTIAALDFDTFFEEGLIDKVVDKFYTDDVRQYSNFKEQVCKPHDMVPVELGDAMVGKYPLRESHDEIIYSMTIGLAIEDLILAHEVYLRAVEKGIGTILKR